MAASSRIRCGTEPALPPLPLDAIRAAGHADGKGEGSDDEGRGAANILPPGIRAGPVKPHLSVLPLGVADLDRAVAFYRNGLGLPTPGVVGREYEHGAVAFFDLSGGLKLA